MKDWFKNNIISSLSLATLLTMAFFGKELQLRLFPDVETRIETVDHIKGLPTPEEKAKAELLDSLYTQNAITSRARRDSIMAHQDSLLKVLILDLKGKDILLEDIFKRLKLQPDEEID